MTERVRARIPWNDRWNFSPDFAPAMCGDDWQGEMQPVRLPHTMAETPYNYFDESVYQMVGAYRRVFRAAPDWQGKRVTLVVGAAAHSAVVYLNGQELCRHNSGYTAFSAELGPYLRFGADNVLLISVDSRETQDIPPFGKVIDYMTYGGLYRGAELLVRNAECIEDVFAKAVTVTVKSPGCGDVLLDCPVTHTGRPDTELQQTLVCEASGEETVFPRGETKHTVADARLWSTAQPALCRLRTQLWRGGELLDEREDRIGLRAVDFRADGLYVNGEKTPLRGLDRHQSFPYVGYAMPRSLQRRDADILRFELGCNAVRTSHYPQSHDFLERCDELGLLVFTELPGWQHIGGEAWQAQAVENVREMVLQYRNHPSIFLWGVRINESLDDDAFYTRTNALAHELDDTRPTSGVRYLKKSSLLEDVYAYNDFSCDSSAHPGCRPRKKVTPDPGKGYLISEYNGHMYPTKSADPEARRTEHALRHLRVLDAAGRSRRISGAIGWCMADYNTHRDFGSGDRVCHHGVLDMHRLPKTAAAAYASQQEERPFLEVASSMDIGEHDAAALTEVPVFTNCDAVRLYRNGEPVGTFQPDRKAWPGLAHPPVVIRDFIGDRLERQEGLSHGDAEAIKRVLRAIVRYGDKSLPMRYKLAMGWQMLKNRLSYQRAVGFYERYVGNWGEKSLTWRFEGIRDGKVVLTVEKGAASDGGLFVLPDRTSLCEAETWDACRVVIRHLDARGNRCVHSREVVAVNAEGAGEIIGPRLLPLTGGATAFWVRTNGMAGKLSVAVRSERYGSSSIVFEVEKRSPSSPQA